MKKIYFVLSLALLTTLASAQGYYLVSSINAGINPGDLNNDPEQPSGALTPLGWTEIMTSTSTDQWSSNQTIPFAFNFDGSAETSYKVSNTGVLTFTTSASTVPSSTNQALPDANIPDKSVCVWGIELSGSNDAILTQTFGTAPNRQHWISWASASIPGASGTQWTYWSIILEEGTNSIYIVDQRTTGGSPDVTIGIQTSAMSAVSESSSPTVPIRSNDIPDASDNTFYEFAYGTQPQYDLHLSTYTAAEMVGINNPIASGGSVRNRGSQTVTSFDLSYSVNGSVAVTNTITGNINTGAYAAAAPTIQFTPPSPGNYNMKVWVSNINGNPDGFNANDTIDLSFSAALSVPRNILAEEFSSSTCPPCASWNTNVYNAALANYNVAGGDKIVVKYQVPIPVAGDPSHNGDADARRAYYGVNAAPTMVMNGVAIDYSSAATWADAANLYTQTETDALASPAFVSITASADYSPGTGVANVSATVSPNVDMTNGNFAIQMVVLQKAYTFNGATNGDFDYHHVMRKMLPTPNGTSLNVAAGANQTVNESYTFTQTTAPAEGSFDLWNHDIEVIVFVENTSTNSIMNAVVAPVTIGLDESANTLKVRAYPNPAKDVFYVMNDASENEEVKVELVNSVGQKVYSNTYKGGETIEVNTTSFDAGMYIINVIKGEELGSSRIAITK